MEEKIEKGNPVALAMQYLVWLNYSVVIPPANIKTNNNNIHFFICRFHNSSSDKSKMTFIDTIDDVNR